MRLIIATILAISAVSSGAWAQNGIDQSQTGPPNTMPMTAQQAPVGHRQPRAKDLPPDVAQSGPKAISRDKALNKKLIICRGC